MSFKAELNGKRKPGLLTPEYIHTYVHSVMHPCMHGLSLALINH